MDHFVLKERCIVLHRTDPLREAPRQLSGDVARLADGRLFARWELQGLGGPIEGCREYHEGEDPVMVPWPATDDPWRWQQEKLDARPEWHRWTRDADRGEFDRFAEQWPQVAAFLGVTRYDNPRLVDCGDVFYPKRFPLPEWREYLDRHCDGDYGEFGVHPAESIDVSTAWTITLQDERTRARHAVDSGRGVIRSRFIMEPVLEPYRGSGGVMRDGSDRPGPKVIPRTCDITTVYAAAGKRTLIQLIS